MSREHSTAAVGFHFGGRPRNWQRSARWYQAFCFFFFLDVALYCTYVPGIILSYRATTIAFSRPHTKTMISFWGGMYQKQQHQEQACTLLYTCVARSRCCPAATVPAAVVFACGVRCCIAEIAEKNKNKIVNRKTELCHHRPQPKAHSNEYENNTHKAEQSLPAWRGAGRSNRACLLYTSPSPRDGLLSRMPSSA